jgi:pimeloyl-ACP methyl ester carboxylesterase
MDAREAAAKITAPVLYLAADLDGTYADQAKELYGLSTSSKDRRMTVVPGSQHGVPLMVPSVDLEAGSAVTDFLRTHAKP